MFKFMNKCQNAMPILTDIVILIAAAGVIYTLWNMNHTINRVADNMENMTTAVVSMNKEVTHMNSHIHNMDTQTQIMAANTVNLANEMHAMNMIMSNMDNSVHNMNRNVRKMSPFSFMPW